MTDALKSFSGRTFVQALASEGGLEDLPVGLSIEGLAKKLSVEEPPPLKAEAFLFSPGKSCSHWLPIPATVVERVEHLGSETCDGVQLPYVRLYLQYPTSLEGATFLSLWAAFLPENPPQMPSDAESDSATSSMMLHASLTGAFDRWKCARCVSINLALGLAVAAGVAALGPAIGAATAVSSLMAQFGISEAVATAAVGGASGATMARMMCKGSC